MMGIPALVVNVLCGLRQIIGRVGKTAYNNSEDVVAKGYVTAHLYIKMLNRKTIYFLQMETKKVTSNRIAYLRPCVLFRIYPSLIFNSRANNKCHCYCRPRHLHDWAAHCEHMKKWESILFSQSMKTIRWIQ